MLKQLLTLLFFIFNLDLYAQKAYLIAPQGGKFVLNELNFESCENREVCSGDYDILNQLINLAIGPGGVFYGGSSNGTFVKIDTINCSTTEITKTGISTIGMVCDADGNLIFGTRGIYKLNPVSLKVDTLISQFLDPFHGISGDITIYRGEIYWVSNNSKLFKFLSKDNYEEVLAIGFRSVTLFSSSIDCQNDQLFTIKRDSMQLIEIDLKLKKLNVVCEIKDFLTANSFDAASLYESNGQRCVLKMDLDGDDSGGRVGKDYQNQDTCKTAGLFDLGDLDVRVVSYYKIDSVRVQLPSGLNGLLFSPFSSDWDLSNQGNNRWWITNKGGGTDTTLGQFLSNLQLQLNSPAAPGNYEIYFYVNNESGLSDTAVYYLKIGAVKSAGPDRTINLCAEQLPRPIQAYLHPGASAGGSWSPGPTITGSGTWYYVTSSPGCGSDSARYTIAVRSIPLPLLGADTSLCEGQSLTLQVQAPGANITWSTGSTNSQITVQQSGVYTVQASLGTCVYRDTIAVTFQERDTVFTNQTFCVGDTARIQGMMYTTDTTVCYEQPGSQACPQMICTALKFSSTPVVEKDSLVCAFPVQWKNQMIQQPGTYTVQQKEGNCLVNYRLRIGAFPVPDFFEDSVFQCQPGPLLLDARPYNANFLLANGTQSPTLTITQTGKVPLILIDENDCERKDTVLLIDDALTAIQWKIESPKCRGDKGVITLTGSDLDKIRQVLLDGESMPLSDIYFVFPGTHTLELISEGACQTDSTFEI